jgi:hypothetical protein
MKGDRLSLGYIFEVWKGAIAQQNAGNPQYPKTLDGCFYASSPATVRPPNRATSGPW